MRQWWIVPLTGISVILTGCDGVRKTLGLDKDAPDEFAVVARAPISLPPNFHELPTPVAPQHGHVAGDVFGAPDVRPQEQSPHAKAEKSIFGVTAGNTAASAKLTPGEQAFVKEAYKEIPKEGPQENIRDLINKETHTLPDNKPEWVKKLLFWQKDKVHHKEALDPSKEYTELYGELPEEVAVTQ